MTMQERRSRVRRDQDRALRELLTKYDQERRKGADSHSGEGAEKARRRAIRHLCKAEVTVPLMHSTGGLAGSWETENKTLKGRMLDLSYDGGAVFTRLPLEMGAMVRIAIDLDGKKALDLQAQVRWVKHVRGKEGYACGLLFMAMSIKDQRLIEQFLKDLDENLGL